MKPYYDEAGIQIYHGDCREILPGLPQVDAVVTDPPYGIAYESGWSKETRGHAAKIAGDHDTSLRDFAIDIGLPTASFATWRCTPPRRPAGCLIWDKGENVGMGDLSFPWKPNFEVVWIFGDGWAGRRTTSVLRGSAQVTTSQMGRLHPHQKPVWLLRTIINKAPSGTILDPFVGSGATLRAAKDLGRNAIGIELDERYCEIAAKRLSQEAFDFRSSR
ncbi:MAG: DNA methyltransferase [Nannocystaceae bacterium]